VAQPAPTVPATASIPQSTPKADSVAASTKPVPQALIKLEPASAARKRTSVPTQSPVKAEAPGGTGDEETSADSDTETGSEASDIPMPIAIAVLALAVLALAVQVWTLLS
jgi:cobalamin biosynthesis Mg chelatase CobN